MIHKLFAARSSHPLASTRSRRLELESLEDRLVPAFISTGPFPDDLMGNLPSSRISASSALGMSGFSSAMSGNSTSFGQNGFTAVGFQVPFGSSAAGFSSAPSAAGLPGGASATSQLRQLEQDIAILYPLAASQNAPQASSLVSDEFYLAIDTFSVFLNQAHGIYNPSFQDLPARENAINQNPLELTPVGRTLGSMVFEATELLATTRFGAGTGV